MRNSRLSYRYVHSPVLLASIGGTLIGFLLLHIADPLLPESSQMVSSNFEHYK